ncbi:hypothetical protein ACQPXH_17525 [Nocardia sp. CA-135953]|uniref:hypothetical protein n=1 Tax=Nocardia sp. CA-135953 TaxID=3239978 RepID=UPI003D980B74
MRLDLVLRFLPDDALRRYFDALEDPSLDATGRYELGYIYLSIHDGPWSVLPDHLLFSFTAASTMMSGLFAGSESIRDWFVWMTVRTGASVCTLQMEDLDVVYYAHGRRMEEFVHGDDGEPSKTCFRSSNVLDTRPISPLS